MSHASDAAHAAHHPGHAGAGDHTHGGHGGHGHDDWFSHSKAEGLPQAEHAAHVSSTALGVTLLVIVFGVFGVVLLLALYFGAYATNTVAMLREGVLPVAEPYLAYREQEKADLASPPAASGRPTLQQARSIVLAGSTAGGVPAEWVGPTLLAPRQAPAASPTDSHSAPHE